MNPPAARINKCPTHGRYIARHLAEAVFTDCPRCVDEALDAWNQSAGVKHPTVAPRARARRPR